jgi:hypothetical protein
MRSSPHEGFSCAIWRISRWSSGGIRGRPDWHFLRQNSSKPWWCQLIKVLGVDCQRASPIEQAAQPEQGETRWMGDPAGLDSTFLIEHELFAQEEILSRERAFGS